MMTHTTSALFARAEQAARADGKDAYFRLHRYRYAAVLEALPPPPATVLEVGGNARSVYAHTGRVGLPHEWSRP